MTNQTIIMFIGAAIAGLGIGNFLTTVTWRIPRELPIGPAACSTCSTPLRPRHQVPLLSWACAGGRCRNCDQAIPVRYPLIEVATAALFVLIVLRAPTPGLTAALAVLGVILLALAVVDLEHGLLPNALNLAAIPPALVVRWLDDGQVAAGLVGAAAAVGLTWLLKASFEKVTGRDGLGWGDVKFIAVPGLLLQPAEWPLYLVLAGSIGLVMAGAWRAAGKGEEFPFGPALITALLVLVLFPEIGAAMLAD